MNRVDPFVSQSYHSKIFRCYNPRTHLSKAQRMYSDKFKYTFKVSKMANVFIYY